MSLTCADATQRPASKSFERRRHRTGISKEFLRTIYVSRLQRVVRIRAVPAGRQPTGAHARKPACGVAAEGLRPVAPDGPKPWPCVLETGIDVVALAGHVRGGSQSLVPDLDAAHGTATGSLPTSSSIHPPTRCRRQLNQPLLDLRSRRRWGGGSGGGPSFWLPFLSRHLPFIWRDRDKRRAGRPPAHPWLPHP